MKASASIIAFGEMIASAFHYQTDNSSGRINQAKMPSMTSYMKIQFSRQILSNARTKLN